MTQKEEQNEQPSKEDQGGMTRKARAVCMSWGAGLIIFGAILLILRITDFFKYEFQDEDSGLLLIIGLGLIGLGVFLVIIPIIHGAPPSEEPRRRIWPPE